MAGVTPPVQYARLSSIRTYHINKTQDFPHISKISSLSPATLGGFSFGVLPDWPLPSSQFTSQFFENRWKVLDQRSHSPPIEILLGSVQ